jgi:hypothetical protein
VTDHGSAGNVEANVELETVAAMLERKVEGRKRVFRDAGGHTSATMAEEEGKIGHCEF